MKAIIITSKKGYEDIFVYGKDLFEQMKKGFDVVVYDTINANFSNIKELFNSDEKLILFNQFAIPGGFEPLTKCLPSFKNIKYLLSPYSAYKGLDLELLKKLGIRYRNNAGSNAKSVAQYDIAMMFMLLSRVPELSKQKTMPDGSVLGEEYRKKTAGIIGMGNVGRELLSILESLKIPTVYYNRSKKNIKAQRVSLDEIFRQDIIFIAIATNEETKKLLKNLPELIQKHNYIIDGTSIDELYDKKKVVEMLNDDKFKGYAVEVFDPKHFKLTSNKNFIATPHIAWCTVDAEKRTVENYLNRGLAILRGNISGVDFIV